VSVKTSHQFSARRTLLGRDPLRERVAISRFYTRAHRRRRPSTRTGLDIALRALSVGALLACGVLLAAQAGGAFEATVASVQRSVGEVLGFAPLGPRDGSGDATPVLSAAPILDSLEAYTREASIIVSGRLPSHVAALSERPRVEIMVNSALMASPATDEQGRFSSTVALTPGANVIVAVSARIGERAESASRTVILDTTAPTLTVSRPTNGAQLDGPTVTIAGKSEKGAFISVNGHAVAVTPEGNFSDTLHADPGPLTIEVIARDAAGNQTRRVINVTVRQSGATGGLGVIVSLDRTSARPGQRVSADVIVSDDGAPAAGVQVTVNVGLTRVGSGTTDGAGRVRIAFTTPTTDGFVQVVALASKNGETGRGSALLEVRP
jgi:hypothetical protein